MIRVRRLASVAAAAALALAVVLPAAALGPLRLELPPNQPNVYVYDLAGIWTDATEAKAQDIAAGIRARTQAVVVVVSWPSGLGSVDTGTARADAIAIMDAWGVGRAGVNDGLVVIFDMDTTNRHGQVYLYAGEGYLNSYLSESEAAGIVDGDMLPKAKDGDLDGALIAGLEHVDRVTQVGGNPERAFKAVLQVVLQVLVIGIALLLFARFLWVWWQRGRDAQVPLIDDSVLLPAPPPELTPAIATVLRKDGVDREAFTTGLVDLGHRGLVTFRAAEDSESHVDLVVPDAPLVDDASRIARERPLGTAETRLVASVRAAAGGDGVVTWDTLKQGKGATLYEGFKKDLGKAAAASGWFRDDPNRLTSRWAAIGAVMAFAPLVLFGIAACVSGDTPEGWGYLLGPTVVLIVLGIVIAVAARFLAARTADGAQTLAMALAYRNTLRWELQNAPTIDQAVEKTKSRLPWISTPDLLTVWAVALGLKSEIDALIKATFEQAQSTGGMYWAPLWYIGSSGSTPSVSGLTGMVGAIGTVGTTVSSSSGG
ncbi:MAG TPA: TPM domain-containing protein, partial [Candidatus Acidoferrales bacterium]|nr:TPM domain-containing protein [Candidatus Acidoferrales bacterium]